MDVCMEDCEVPLELEESQKINSDKKQSDSIAAAFFDGEGQNKDLLKLRPSSEHWEEC